MNEERFDVSETENADTKYPPKKGVFHKLGRGIVRLFTAAGLSAVKVFAAVLLGIIKGVKFIASEMWSFVTAVAGLLKTVFFVLVEPLRMRFRKTEKLQKDLRKAKKKGADVYRRTLIRGIGSYLFGEYGVFYSVFNYVLPIVSAVFLIGVIAYGRGLEYGISVEYNGTELGVISAEADFDEAEREVQQRFAFDNNENPVDLSANFSLRIISDQDKILSSAQLANKLLEASDEELTEAYGIYIDGRFIGAVRNTEPVQDALNERLLNYEVEGTVRDVEYQNKIDYSEGIYLAESVMTEEDAIKLLTSSKSHNGVYIAQKGDSPFVVCEKYNMTAEEFKAINPTIKDSLTEGQIIAVKESENYLPIQYVREMENLTFLDYETIEVETSSLNVGTTAVIVKGEKGEKISNIEVTYVDGIERSTKVVASEITKMPVTEQVGIGTYAARPASPSTKVYGSGQFGWPVDGGYISDTFISDRNHKGLDIAAPGGTDIYAAGEGVVVTAGWNSGGYGYVVMIDHLDGYQTVYAHMSEVYAVAGQEVTRGQLIGAVGTTGNSTGDHCHFEVRYMGVCYDPESFLNTLDAFKEDDEDDD